MLTIGQKLAETRQEKGLSVEDVSHKTRIHANTIRGIESDDLSRFPSVAYAKSFLRTYADFLEVDISHTLDALDAAGTIRLGDNELMGEMKKTIRKDRRFRLERRPKSYRRRSEKPGGAPIFLNLILGVLISALCVFYFLGYKTSSPEEARSSISRGLQKANPFGPGEESLTETGGNPAEERGETIEVNPIGEGAIETIESNPIAERPTLVPVDLEGTDPANPAPAAIAGAEDEGNENAAAVANPVDPAGEIAKPEVSWDVEAARPAPLARVGGVDTSLAPRQTPSIRVEGQDRETPSYPVNDLPAVRRVLEEPDASLRPAGTDPAGVRSDETEGSGRQSGARNGIIAVPVATNE
ncbi:MAG: helix-turn-helix domain-containing protein [Verrucomicrobiota bacterium]